MVKWIIIIGLITLIVIFAALNSQSVEINYLFGKQVLPLAFLLFLGMLVGVIITSIFLMPQILIFKHRIKQLRKE